MPGLDIANGSQPFLFKECSKEIQGRLVPFQGLRAMVPPNVILNVRFNGIGNAHTLPFSSGERTAIAQLDLALLVRDQVWFAAHWHEHSSPQVVSLCEGAKMCLYWMRIHEKNGARFGP